MHDGTTINRFTPVPIDVVTGRIVSKVAVGKWHLCCILDDSSLKCWDRNNYGQLGNGNTTDSTSPKLISFDVGRTVRQITLKERHTCTVLDDASVKYWGRNQCGQVGDGTTVDKLTPILITVDDKANVATIKTIYQHICTILDSNTLKCWGRNSYAGLGDGTTTHRRSRVVINIGDGRTAIQATGAFRTCSLLDDCAVKCRGRETYGHLGNGETVDKLNPT